MKRVIIEIWADINCPFCYIGEVMLGNVLQQELEAGTHVEVYWRSYRLHAALPEGEVKHWQELMTEVETAEERQRYEEGQRRIAVLAEPYQLNIVQEHTVLHNSVDAARLLKLANKHQKVLAVAQAFGKGFFEEGLDMSLHPNLRQKAVEAGLPADEVEQVLASELYRDEVEEDQRLAELYAPNFIPTFYFNGAERLEGVVSEAELEASLRSAKAKL